MDQSIPENPLTLHTAFQALAKLMEHFAVLLTRRAAEQPEADLLKETDVLTCCFTTLYAIDRARQRRGDDPRITEHAIRTAVKMSKRIAAEEAKYQASEPSSRARIIAI